MEHLEAFLPSHSVCWNFDFRLIALHVVADSLFALAYLVIPFALYLIARRLGLHLFQSWAMWFAAFIFLCGLTHISDVNLVYQGGDWYWVDGWLRLVGGAVSIYVALKLCRHAPQLIATLKRVAEMMRTFESREAELRDSGSYGRPRDVEFADVLHEARGLLETLLSYVPVNGSITKNKG